MPRRIHLIEKLSLFRKIAGNVHESGYWEVAPQIADELVGGDIYFHRKQKEPSFFGGKILGYRIHDEDDEYPRGRIIFRFEAARSHRGVLAGGSGWSYEKKII
jgi:hypothetical protein